MEIYTTASLSMTGAAVGTSPVFVFRGADCPFGVPSIAPDGGAGHRSAMPSSKARAL